MSRPPVPTLEEIRGWPATVSITEAATALGVSRTTLYELMRIGESPVKILKLGSSRRVVTASLIAVLDSDA